MANQLFSNFPELQYTLSTGKVVTIKDFFRKATIEQDAVNSVIDYTYYELLDGERPDVVATKLYGSGDLHWTLFLVNDWSNYYEWHMDQETLTNYLTEKYPGVWLLAANTTDIVDATTYDKDNTPWTITGTSKFNFGEQVTNGTYTANVIKIEPQHKRICVDGNGTWLVNETVTTNRIEDSHLYYDDGTPQKSFTITAVQNGIDGTAYYKDSNGIIKNYSDTGFSSVSYETVEYDENEKKRNIKIIKPEYIRGVVSEFEKVMMG